MPLGTIRFQGGPGTPVRFIFRIGGRRRTRSQCLSARSVFETVLARLSSSSTVYLAEDGEHDSHTLTSTQRFPGVTGAPTSSSSVNLGTHPRTRTETEPGLGRTPLPIGVDGHSILVPTLRFELRLYRF